LAALALCLSLSAGQGGEKPNPVRFEDLPDAAQRALTLQSDGDAIGEITRGFDAYLIEFTAEGKSQEVLVREDLTSEGPRPARAEGKKGVEIKWEDLPPAVQTFVSSKFAGVSLEKIHRRPAIYRAKIDRNGEAAEIQFTERGRILAEVTEREGQQRKLEAEAREAELKAKREAEAHELELKAKGQQ